MINMGPLEVKVVASRPVDWSEAALPGLPETPVYPGSIKDFCKECGIDVWVGPMQQQFMKENQDVTLLCFQCAGVLANQGMQFEVRTLGNDFKRKEG